MPVFECSKCKAMENTALGHYWDMAPFGKKPLCSECADGRWHNMFPKRTKEQADYELSSDGFIGPRKDKHA